MTSKKQMATKVAYWFAMATVGGLLLLLLVGCGGYRSMVRDVVSQCEPTTVNLKYKQKQLSMDCREESNGTVRPQ